MSAGALDLPAEYVRLGLRFDRVEPGFVDAFTGDPRTRAQILDEPAPTPRQLRDRARRPQGRWAGSRPPSVQCAPWASRAADAAACRCRRR